MSDDGGEGAAPGRDDATIDGDVARPSDPRLDESYVRRIKAADAGDVVLLGAVHDHPASSFRVAALVRAADPDVLALELAPLALPWFEARATDGRATTCEMTAAVAAAPGARVAGIDWFDAEFFRTLRANLRAAGPSWPTVRAVAKGVAAVAKHAAACRLAALVERHAPFEPAVDEPVEHGCDPSDPPAIQAADERRRASTSLSLLRATEPPAPVAVRDETREACMVRRIEALREEGDVAAVLGLGHLDAVAAGLAATA